MAAPAWRKDRLSWPGAQAGRKHLLVGWARSVRNRGGTLMRKLIVLAAALLAAAGALAVHVTQSDARWHVLSETAINTNKLCTDGLRYTWASGSTATQPPANRPVGQPRFLGPVNLFVQHAPANTPNDDADWFNTGYAGGITFTADYAPVFNPDAQLWYPY